MSFSSIFKRKIRLRRSDNFCNFNFDNTNLLKELKQLNKDNNAFTYIPNNGNMGDMLIAGATLLFFDDNNLKYKMYEGKSDRYIVYGGGGVWTNNYKDFWYNEILPVFKTAEKIIILPSSFYNCQELIDVLDERFVVFCREKQSYDYLLGFNTKAKIYLDNNMAFIMTNKIFDYKIVMTKNEKRTVKNLYNDFKASKKNNFVKLLRQDVESIYKNNEEFKTDLDLSAYLYGSQYSSKEWIIFSSQLMLSFTDYFKIIVSDRLHVGIAGALMGKEVYLLDNSYKKISNVYNNSLKDNKNIHLLNNINEISNIDKTMINKQSSRNNLISLLEKNFFKRLIKKRRGYC